MCSIIRLEIRRCKSDFFLVSFFALCFLIRQARMIAYSMSEEEDRADDMDMMFCAMSAPPPALPVMDTATAEVKITLRAL